MLKKAIYYSIDSLVIEEKSIRVVGWCCDRFGECMNDIFIADNTGKKCSGIVKKLQRNDATNVIAKKNDSSNVGFSINVSTEANKKYSLYFVNDKKTKKISLSSKLLFEKKLARMYRNFLANKDNGTLFRSFAQNSKITYNEWYMMTMAKDPELKKQRETRFDENAPLFSILVPLYNTPEKFLKEMIQSVLDQTYSKWELCLADGSDSDHAGKIEQIINGFHDERIKYKKLISNEGISENTNRALEMASGDFIVLFDHDDLLTKNALFEFAEVILKDPACDCIYSDEDKIDSDTGKLFDPNFKPDYNIDMLCSVNYICHLFAVRKELVDKYGGFRKEYDGAQDHDFIFRMTENSRHVVHVPKILYHWRYHQNSTAANPESKLYAYKAGEKAIMAHYKRVWPEVKIERVEQGISLGIYHTVWHFDEYPLISVIIPNMDHTSDLDKAIRSMVTKGTWPNLEFIVIENNSKEQTTFDYYKKIQNEFNNVHVVYYKGEFNYSKINNFGVRYAKGEYYLLMNNDIELIEPDSLKEMMGYCQRQDVGIVGARLLYSDNTIQHAGVIVGIGGIAGHAFKYKKSENDTYFNRAMVAQDYSAVTAAVMLVKKSVFDSVHGLDESFVVALNDVDFCLRVRETGKLVVYTPYACFHHYESKSRGLEDTEEKQARFRREIARFVERYESFLKKGDPYYSPNLTLLTEDFGIRNVKYEKNGDQFYTKKELENFKNMTQDDNKSETKQ